MRHLIGKDGKLIPGTETAAISIHAIEAELERLLAALDGNAWLAGAKSGVEAEDDLRDSILHFETAARTLRSMIERRLGGATGSEVPDDPAPISQR